MKRWFTVLTLIVCLLLSSLPVSAVAPATSGTCGENLTWALDAEGTLTISGKGEMENYSGFDRTPWFDVHEKIRSIVVEEGSLSIGNHAFNSCSLAKTATLPSTLERIGASAFAFCSGLTALAVPESVTVIGESAFRNCGFTEFKFPSKATRIEADTFFGCTSLKQITLHPDITSIGHASFILCESLQEITLPEKLESLDEYSFSDCSSLTSIVIPSGVSEIPFGCFRNCSNLQRVVLPDGITAIEGIAFTHCNALTEINLPDALTTIGEEAFFDCSGLPEIAIPSKVSRIDRGAFEYCTSLIAFHVAEDNLWYSSDSQGSLIRKADSALVYCPATFEGNYTIPTGITRIIWNAFRGCTKLTSVIVPASVTNIESGAIGGFDSDISICFMGDAPQMDYYPFTPNATLYFLEGAKGWTAPVFGEEEYQSAMWNGEQIPMPHAHSYTSSTRAPSCTECGCTVHSCTGGDYYYTDYVDALGHNFNETTGICTRCGTKDPDYIPTEIVEFDDVPANAWYKSAVDYAVANKLMNGVGSGKFDPDGSMTRAMLVTVLWRYAGSPKEGTNTFTDVPNGQWYTDAVAWAAHNGVVSGIGNGKFDPSGNVTREQMAAILYRYAGSIGINTAKRGTLSSFPDVGSVSDWSKDALSWAVAEGIITGSDAHLLPRGNATRAQVSAILMRFIQNTAK